MSRRTRLLFVALLASTPLPASASEAVRVTLRESATVGARVTLADVARIDGDVGTDVSGRSVPVDADGTVSLRDVVTALRDAGVRSDRLLVRGPEHCVVVRRPGAEGVQETHEAGVPDEWGVLASPAVHHGVAFVIPAATDARTQTLAVLRGRIAATTSLPAESLTIRSRDALPDFVTLATPTGEASLGTSTWRLTSPDGTSSVARIDASATVVRARVSRPVGRGQVIRPEDVEQAAAVVTRMEDVGLDVSAVVGQRAARALHVGEPLAARDLAAPVLVRRGQLVTVTLDRGGVLVRTLARSQGDALFGEVVRCRIEATGEVLGVVVTGPQAGSVAF